MACLRRPLHPSGQRSPYWQLVCYDRRTRRKHYIRLKYPDGRPVKDRRDALALLREHERMCGQTLEPSRRVDALLDQYLEATRSRRGVRTQQQEVLKANRLRPLLAPYTIERLTPGVIQDVLNTLAQTPFRRPKTKASTVTMSGVTRDHYLKLLRAFARWCVFRGYLLRDVTAGVTKIGKQSSRDYLPREQWDAFLAQAEGSVYAACVRTALFTGLRRGELLQLEARDVDLRRRVLLVRPEVAKTNEAAELPLGRELMAVLRPIVARLRPTQRVFPFYGDALQRQVRTWLEALGYTGTLLGMHTLRHSFATHAYRTYGALEAQKLCRHTSLATTTKYIHLAKMPVTPTQMDRF